MMMMHVFLFSLCLAGFALALPKEFALPTLTNNGKHWALLVAGSNGWMNYRHQADVCHAYQILKKHGLPDERIIVMMEDDIAFNRENPEKGTIINQPNGPDVYQGVPHDYTGKLVTPDVFLDVMQGNKEALVGKGSGKVLDSGPNDNVFINFVDHGAPNLIAFGSKFLHSKDLIPVIKKMHKEKKFAKLLFYLESCESGSMFKNVLPDKINVLALTAANSTQSSYACYFDKERKTYLGDVFSEMWMQDSDKENLNTETIEQQFKKTKKKTNTSHVMEFGDKDILQMTVGEFQGKQSKQSNTFEGNDNMRFRPSPPDPTVDAVKSEDVDLKILENLLMLSQDEKEKSELQNQIWMLQKKRSYVDTTVRSIVSMAVNDNSHVKDAIMEERLDLTQHDCYADTVEYLRDTCPKMDIPNFQYSLRRLYVFVNLCQRLPSSTVIKSAIDKAC